MGIKSYKIIISTNLILFLGIFFIFDFIVYKHACHDFLKAHPEDGRELKYSYITYIPNYIVDISNYFNGYWGRRPDGLEYSAKNPIAVFGGSYAYGEYLNANQTFTHKLSDILKRPVYNRGGVGWSFQHMYFQTESDALYKDLPKNTDTVIYVMIDDHLRRCMLEHFFIIENWAYLHYSLKHGQLVIDNYKNPFSNFYRALYVRKAYNHKMAVKYEKGKEKDVKNIINLSVKYIVDSKSNIENHLGKKVNFIVLYYEPGNWLVPYKEEITSLLNKADIKAISTVDLTDEDLLSETYMMHENWHPNETAWNLLTPLFLQKLNLTD